MRWRETILAVCICGTALAEGPADKPEKDGADFDVPVPVGMPVKGIKIPHRDENGKLVMVLEAAQAQKIDETNVAMTTLHIEAYDEDGKKILVDLPQGMFNLQTRVLTGNQSVTISREDFDITGDSVDFNTKTRNGVVRGNVKMTILTEEEPQ